ncbi:MAG: type III-B CRISPR module RAMP protein Cmr1 [Methanobacteriota archaeon]|nr:MAG: type III-B CRISPR module RAMP protein Cmr1 [Euryarchaeota archaeon]
MDRITFTCETITPMFLAGADSRTPELRPPSIKGAMRFWWRALHGHLSLKELKETESKIFGGTGTVQARSCFSIQVKPKGSPREIKTRPLPHSQSKTFVLSAFGVGTRFEVSFSMKDSLKDQNGTVMFGMNHLTKLFLLTCYLGGFGKRVRRGFGSVDVVEINEGRDGIPMEINLQYINGLIQSFSPYYTLSNDRISFSFPGKAPAYGYLVKVELGEPYSKEDQLLRKVGQATHDLKKRHGHVYEASMGFAGRQGRFASPVFVSVVRGSVRPLVSTLNLAPPRNAARASLDVQNEFKNRIL